MGVIASLVRRRLPSWVQGQTDLSRFVEISDGQQRCHAGGGHSDVWRCTFRPNRTSAFEVAGKVVRPNNTIDRETRDRDLQNEIGIWSRLSHPNIAPLLGTCDPCSLGPLVYQDHIVLICPFYREGTLLQYIKNRCPSSTGSNNGEVLRFKLKLLVQVAEVLAYMHREGIAHGDVKSLNIMIDDDRDVRLIDFGLARHFRVRNGDRGLESAGPSRDAGGGTARWMAPELLAPQGNEGESNLDVFIPLVNPASDVWAFAMVGLEILTGCQPFHHIQHNTGVIIAVNHGIAPDRSRYPDAETQVPTEVWRILERCWAYRPSDRPTMEEVLVDLRQLLLAEIEADEGAGAHEGGGSMATQRVDDDGDGEG